MRIDRILVPVDFSEHANAALRAAAAVARNSSATIHLLHVTAPATYGVIAVEPMFAPPRVMENLHQERVSRAEAELTTMEGEVRTALPEARVSSEVASGDPVEVICERAEAADLVVLGSHGLTGAARFLLGSTAEKVSRRAPCPVLIMNEDSDDADGEPRFRRAMVGVDYSPFSEAAARLASTVAEPGAVIELVHVWTPPWFPSMEATGSLAPELTVATEKQRAAEADRLASFAAEIGLSGVDTVVASGSPTDQLLERIGASKPDLVVLGSHGRDTWTEKILGTVADRVLRHAGVPVLLLPETARDAWS